MDPLTQTLIGSAAAGLLRGPRPEARGLILIGGLAGLLPDADVFIRSASDPLLAVEVHRQFTHSLAFIPIGGAITALPWIRKYGRRAIAAGITGWATHGLLDACTTYGTQLLWPFSNTRVAWHAISILDPVFTLALLIGVVLAAVRRSRLPVVIALAFCLAYLSLGVVQRNRARDAQHALAASRGHTIVRGETFPTVGNQLVWRSLYEAGGTLHADRIRVPWSGRPQFAPGTAVPTYELPPALQAMPRIARDFRRFRWFSGGWVAADPGDPSIIGDVRYSLRTEAFDPIWGVRFRPGRAVPTEWVNRSRDRKISIRALWSEIDGSDPRYRPIRPRDTVMVDAALQPDVR